MSWIEFRDVIGLLFRVTERLKTSGWRGGDLGMQCSLRGENRRERHRALGFERQVSHLVLESGKSASDEAMMP